MYNKTVESQFADAFELDKAELNYRFKRKEKMSDASIVLIHPKEDYATWAKRYKEDTSSSDVYDYIIENIAQEEIEILSENKAEQYINNNPIFDTDQKYITRKIDELLTFNNIKLVNVTAQNIANIYYDDILNHGNVIQYILDEDFIKSLIDKGFVDIKLTSPF
ncbi:hypothetical protein BUY35_07280 [Staphylococcus cohnii]|nr:hypothetical protein BUY35_07280 [Staphylococcus cohnii]